MLTVRGEIHNRARAKQLRDFSGLLFGNITPTDIDGLIEYHGKGYIGIEMKLTGASLGLGQKLAFERLTDDLSRAGKPTIYIIASHDSDDPNEDIDVANAIVSEYRFKGKWRTLQSRYTVRDLAVLFIEKILTKRRVK